MIAPETHFTPLKALGEFGLIDHLTKGWKIQNPDWLVGVGDDCAIYRMDDKRGLLVSTDLLLENIHFDLTYCPLQYLGFKSVAVNCSDIYAMNGKPLAITLGLGLDHRFSVEALETFYQGVRAACASYEIELVGGDTCASRSGLHISVSVLGTVDLDKIVKRSGAKTNDIVCVSGDLGAAYAGLQLLNREKAVFESNPAIQPDLTEYEYVVGRQLRPEARKAVISFFAEKQVVPTAMIDISDGLAADMGHLCRASGVGAVLYQDKLPIDYQTIKTSELFEIPATTYALYGGEDYELLFTLSQADFLRCQGCNLFTAIGYITDQYATPQLILSDGSMSELQPLGYNHFGSEQ